MINNDFDFDRVRDDRMRRKGGKEPKPGYGRFLAMSWNNIYLYVYASICMKGKKGKARRNKVRCA